MRTKTLVASSLAIMLAALAPITATAGDVEFWSPFTGPDGTAIDALVRDFNAGAGAQAGVNVKLLIIPWDDYYTKLSVSMASRTAPDLAVMHSHQIAGFVKQGAVEAYTPEEIATAGLVEAEYLAPLWQAGIVNDQRYGVPIDAFPRHIYYNKALFEQAGLDPDKPPQTGDELHEAAKKIQALGNGVTGLYFQMAGSGAFRNFYSFYWQNEDNLYNADMTDVSEGFIEAAKKSLGTLKLFLDEGLSPKEVLSDATAQFAQNKIGVAILQITDLPVFQTAAAEQGLKFGVAPLPTFGAKPAAFALGHNFVIPRGTPPEARADALVFVKWIGDNSLAWAKTGKIPAKITVIDSPEFQALPEQATIAAALDRVKFPPALSVQPAVDRVVQQTVEAVYAGQLDIDTAAQQMADGIRAELAKK
ncbi:MAG TPA: ABC transporter substrate-binding protein [Devosia sp.]|nr:ABC transporter substrate-binding protein [Devosia sp.]